MPQPIAQTPQEFRGPYFTQVSQQDGRTLPEPHGTCVGMARGKGEVRGGAVVPAVGSVDQVVVHQSEGVKQFQTRSRSQHLIAQWCVADRTPPQTAVQRPDSFTSPIQEVLQYIDQGLDERAVRPVRLVGE